MADREKVKEASLGKKGYHYHKSQYKNPKRSTIALCDFVSRMLPLRDSHYNAIDVGCGGDLIYIIFQKSFLIHNGLV